MSMAVKPHQAFFWPARTDHAAGLVPVPARLPALLPSIFARRRPPLTPGGGGRRRAKMLLRFVHTRLAWRCGRGESDSGRLACSAVRAPGPDDRLSVGSQPRLPAPSTVYAQGVRHAEIEEPTHRTNGAFAGSPGGTSAALSDLAPRLPRPERPQLFISSGTVSLRYTFPVAYGAAAAALA
jgi:hypothetical protein